ncbi:MAG: hypothetical protein CL913_00520 [Deltaproteobacteria bacterium]|nr:hypothetical protein [Deltaproteobacteria bacterium]
MPTFEHQHLNTNIGARTFEYTWQGVGGVGGQKKESLLQLFDLLLCILAGLGGLSNWFRHVLAAFVVLARLIQLYFDAVECFGSCIQGFYCVVFLDVKSFHAKYSNPGLSSHGDLEDILDIAYITLRTWRTWRDFAYITLIRFLFGTGSN